MLKIKNRRRVVSRRSLRVLLKGRKYLTGLKKYTNPFLGQFRRIASLLVSKSNFSRLYKKEMKKLFRGFLMRSVNSAAEG